MQKNLKQYESVIAKPRIKFLGWWKNWSSLLGASDDSGCRGFPKLLWRLVTIRMARFTCNNLKPAKLSPTARNFRDHPWSNKHSKSHSWNLLWVLPSLHHLELSCRRSEVEWPRLNIKIPTGSCLYNLSNVVGSLQLGWEVLKCGPLSSLGYEPHKLYKVDFCSDSTSPPGHSEPDCGY